MTAPTPSLPLGCGPEGSVSKYADLLNDLEDMAGSYAYAVRREVLRNAGRTIMQLERDLAAAKDTISKYHERIISQHAQIDDLKWSLWKIEGKHKAAILEVITKLAAAQEELESVKAHAEAILRWWARSDLSMTEFEIGMERLIEAYRRDFPKDAP